VINGYRLYIPTFKDEPLVKVGITQEPLSSGNTEVFCVSVVPGMLQLVESFRVSFGAPA
jgi:hypothetical protein